MARIAKSLPKPEQGYPHREHRSRKGMTPLANRTLRKKKNMLNKRYEHIELNELGLKQRKGKW